MLFQGESISLFETKSRHYCIPLSHKKLHFMGPVSNRPTLVLTVTDETRFGTDPMAIKQKVEKLHKQFSHPCGDSLKKLLKKAGFERAEYTNSNTNKAPLEHSIQLKIYRIRNL